MPTLASVPSAQAAVRAHEPHDERGLGAVCLSRWRQHFPVDRHDHRRRGDGAFSHRPRLAARARPSCACATSARPRARSSACSDAPRGPRYARRVGWAYLCCTLALRAPLAHGPIIALRARARARGLAHTRAPICAHALSRARTRSLARPRAWGARMHPHTHRSTRRRCTRGCSSSSPSSSRRATLTRRPR